MITGFFTVSVLQFESLIGLSLLRAYCIRTEFSGSRIGTKELLGLFLEVGFWGLRNCQTDFCQYLLTLNRQEKKKTCIMPSVYDGFSGT